MRDISSNLSSAVHALSSGDPLIFLAEVEVPTDPQTRYRLTTHVVDTVFGTSSTGADVTYYRFPIDFDSIKTDVEGSIPIISFMIANGDPALLSTLFTHRGMTGRPVVLRFVLQSELDDVTSHIRFDGKVRAVRVREDGIAFSVSATNLYGRQKPSRRYQAKRCRVTEFGNAECGYPKNATGAAFSTCPRTLAACEARGDDEVVLGLPRQHPERFNAELSMARNRQ
jgi:phage-related protein